MTTSDQIRALAAEGLATADIARRLGIRYQHAYNVLKAGGAVRERISSTHEGARTAKPNKPLLTVEKLLAGGFTHAGRWLMSDDKLALEKPLPKEVGVYAFALRGVVQYIGVATMGLSKRLYFYARPGATQRTSQRLNGIMRTELAGSDPIDIYVALPPDLEWNGLPVHGAAGLELGLIKRYALPWNMRSAR